MKKQLTNNTDKTNTTINNRRDDSKMRNKKARNTIAAILTAVMMAGAVVTAGALCGCSSQQTVAEPNTVSSSAAMATEVTAPATASAQATAPETAPSAQQESAGVTLEEAVTIAISDAGFQPTEVQVTKQQLDIDDSVKKYEIEFIEGDFEYEYDIDTQTGAIIEKSRDSVYD